MSPTPRSFVVGKPHVVAVYDGSIVSFVEHDRDGVSELGSIVIPNSPARRLDTQSEVLIRRIADGRKPVVLRLSEEMGLVCYDRFPETARQDLRSIVAHRLDGLTPWSADKVMFDARVAANLGGSQIEAVIIVAPTQQIDTAIEGLAALGLSATAVDMVVDFPKAPCTLNFLGGTETVQGQGPAAWAVGLAAVLALTVGIGLYVDLDARAQIIEQRDSFAAALQERLADLPELHTRLEGLRHQTDIIAERRHAQPSGLLVIEDLSHILPDGVWLKRLAISGNELQVSGYAPDAEVLLSLIEEQASFANVEFTGPNRPETVLTDGFEVSVDSFALQALIEAPGIQLPLASDGQGQ